MEQYLPTEQSTQDPRQQGHGSPATSEKSSLLQAIAGDSFADSPRQAAQRQTRDRLHGTPRQIAQRQRLESLGQPSPAGGLPDRLKSGIESLSGMSIGEVEQLHGAPLILAIKNGNESRVAPPSDQMIWVGTVLGVLAPREAIMCRWCWGCSGVLA